MRTYRQPPRLRPSRPTGSPQRRPPDRRSSPRAAIRRRRAAAALTTLILLVVGGVVVARTEREPAPPAPSAYPVGERVLALVDPSRQMVVGGRAQRRRLTTYVRYPAAGRPAAPRRTAAPAGRGGPFPLIVFGHGYAYSPGTYTRLIDAWVRAGYVVAAPLFPLENSTAPGGPNRADLPNQPGDVRFLIDRLLAASARAGDPLRGLIDPGRIAVAGHSDGGDTALALAYNSTYRDRRVRAVVSLAGGQLPGVGGWDYAAGGPPLLSVQGSADTINPPADTRAVFDQVTSPRYLLTLPGAAHLPPYTQPGGQLALVRRATLLFFDRYLRGDAAGGRRLAAMARRPGAYSLELAGVR